MIHRHWPRWLAAIAATGAVVAIGGPAGAAAASTARGATVTFALQTGVPPTYILPLTSAADESIVNIAQFQELMWRPLYWFGRGGQPLFNPRLSVGRAPVFSNHGRTVTITLNRYRWSDGRPVTNRDVAFWMHLLVANVGDWYAAVPGGFPSNVVSMQFPARTPQQFTLTFNRAYNPTWLLANELSQIIPIPQHAWDRTKAGGPVGGFDLTASGARQVYRFLDAQSRKTASYATNPLWQVVDGPFHLTGFDPVTGYTTMVPNSSYAGPDKPRIARLEEVPFTSDTAEFDALRSGALDYGYLPVQDLSQRGYLKAHGYRFAPWPLWSFNAITVNFTNPTAGPILDQLYVRQALQRLIDQPAIVRDVLRGYGQANYGPVPLTPANPYVNAAERRSPYTYDPAAARALLAAHGWAIHPNGVDTCRRPGVVAGDCGAGIRRGAPLAFPFQYPSGSVTAAQESEAIASAWSQAGIRTSLSSQSSNALLAADHPCDPKSGLGCHWVFWLYSTALDWVYSPDYLPTGESVLASGAASNPGGYSSVAMDKLIQATQREPGVAPLFRYETYAAQQLPLLWVPSTPAQLSEITTHLHGTRPQDPMEQIYPETWTVSG